MCAFLANHKVDWANFKKVIKKQILLLDFLFRSYVMTGTDANTKIHKYKIQKYTNEYMGAYFMTGTQFFLLAKTNKSQ